MHSICSDCRHISRLSVTIASRPWLTSQFFEVSESLTIDAARVTPILEAIIYLYCYVLYLNLATQRSEETSD